MKIFYLDLETTAWKLKTVNVTDADNVVIM